MPVTVPRLTVPFGPVCTIRPGRGRPPSGRSKGPDGPSGPARTPARDRPLRGWPAGSRRTRPARPAVQRRLAAWLFLFDDEYDDRKARRSCATVEMRDGDARRSSAGAWRAWREFFALALADLWLRADRAGHAGAAVSGSPGAVTVRQLSTRATGLGGGAPAEPQHPAQLTEVRMCCRVFRARWRPCLALIDVANGRADRGAVPPRTARRVRRRVGSSAVEQRHRLLRPGGVAVARGAEPADRARAQLRPSFP